MGEEGGVNLYGFVGNDPVNWVDPQGLASVYNGGVPLFDGYPTIPPGGYLDDFNGGANDFGDNYGQMVNRNVMGADRYYHCMANCEATRRGNGGRSSSVIISAVRELLDFPKNLGKGLSLGDTVSDMKGDLCANETGRNAPPNLTCDQTCRPLLPRTSEPLVPKPYRIP